MFLLYAFILAAFICLLYDLLILARATEKKSEADGMRECCTLLICAHNELPNIKMHLPNWMEQDVDEVLIVDDRSTDGTSEFLKNCGYPESKLKVIGNSGGELMGKRDALVTGIKAARNPILLFTDADCFPAGQDWAKRMTDPFREDSIAVVLGFGAYIKEASILNGLIQIETLETASLYLGAARLGFPYMGVGRNLAFRKDNLLGALEQFSSWDSLSGDDDQLVQLIANRGNTRVVSDIDSTTWSEPKKSWSAWLKQKARHLGAGFNYGWKEKIFAGLFPVSRILRDLLAISCLCMGIYEVLWIWLIGLVIHWFILYRNSLKLNLGLNVYEIVLFDFAWGLYYLVSPLWLSIFKSDKWQ